MCSCSGGRARATRGMRRAFNRKFGARWLGSSASGGAAEVHREQLSPDSAQFCSSRRRNSTLRHPELRKWQNPVVVHPELATMYVGFRTTAESGCTTDPGPSAFGATGGHLEVARCRALCEDGALSDAVDALELLVQRSRHVPCSLFYRALKRCIQNKNLALGKYVHALTVRGGYEGDAFLATHFIVLYASHSRLEEAMRVFIKVPKPSTYNWATIISACARHGEAAEAIRLYRKMYESTTCNPDDRLYSAVLRACTVAKDLVAGKEVHSHILASSGKPQKLAQAGLINMYVKCGCLEDARRIFDRLTNRNVVTWTTMIAGYAQQGMGQEALRLYSSMRQEGVTPNAVTYLCLLQACAIVGVGALNDGKQLHAHIEELGLEENATLGSSLVNMHVLR